MLKRRDWVCGFIAAGVAVLAAAPAAGWAAPSPLVTAGKPVDWFFAFKANAKTAPATFDPNRPCAFGGEPQEYKSTHGQFSLTYGVASSAAKTFAPSVGDIGAGDGDPVGATFGQIYNGGLNFVVWNDQFKSDPDILDCGDGCNKPWAHSKGMLAWDDQGQGIVMQVSTPSWPGAGSKANPRAHDGNTLGCVVDNDVMVSQHFFALKLSKAGVMSVLQALANESAATDPTDPQVVRNGGPPEVRALVRKLGQLSDSTDVQVFKLSDKVRLISKPSKVTAPPWQLVSAELGGVPLLVANWWEKSPKKHPIPDTLAGQTFDCLEARFGPVGAVKNATQGTWSGRPIGLYGGLGADFNHAKVGVSTDAAKPYAIFGDMNQEGSLSKPCNLSQNPRGGMFFVVEDQELRAGVAKLISPPGS